MSRALPSSADVAIIGGGHNALTAAAYLAQAGLRVVVLERLASFGGAAVSEYPFPGVDARLSRYSYLVSLLPQTIITDLRLDIRLAKRRYSSFTPLPGENRGLLIDNHDHEATDESFGTMGCPEDAAAWRKFYADTQAIARVIFPTLTDPLMTRSEVKRLVSSHTGDPGIWERFVDVPIGQTIAGAFTDDLVRGVVLTDALIGTFADNVDPGMDANRCFLYHVIGGGTGDWDVPVGGMGALSSALHRSALDAGAILVAGAEVTALSPGHRLTVSLDGGLHHIDARYVLMGASPRELARLVGRDETPELTEGAQVKVNMVLSRLPKLLDPTITPEQAFGGTFHINETWEQLHAAYQRAAEGAIPDPLPCEVYCHSLTDPSILGPELQASGAHTLTVFGLHAPHRLASSRHPDSLRIELQHAVIASLNSVLAEPIETLLLRDADGQPCIETKTTLDLEEALRLPGGNIFHGPLQWPFADDDHDLSDPPNRWGVDTGIPGVLYCGSGARRGGAVSGIGGHNAAMAILEMESR